MISAILPTDGDPAAFGPTLGALTPGLTAGVLREVLFADAEADPVVAAIADASGAEIVPGPRDRAARLSAAAAAAKGDWMLFLPVGPSLTADWAEAARRHMLRRSDRAGWFRERPRDGALARLSAAGRNAWALWIGLPRESHGLLIARRLYLSAGAPPGPALIRRLGRARLAPLDAALTD